MTEKERRGVERAFKKLGLLPPDYFASKNNVLNGYRISQKSCPVFREYSLYKDGQEFLDKRIKKLETDK